MKHTIPITLLILLAVLPFGMVAVEIGVPPARVVDIPAIVSGYVLVGLFAMLLEDVRSSTRSKPKKQAPLVQPERSRQAVPADNTAWVHQTASP